MKPGRPEPSPSESPMPNPSPEPQGRGLRTGPPRWLILAGVVVGFLVWWFWPQRNYTPVAPPPSALSTSVGAAPEDEKKVFATYAGAESCRACHAKEFEAWSKSNHGLAERALDPAQDRIAFDPAHEIVHGSQKSQAHMSGSQCVMTTLGPENTVADFPIERVIGNDPLRQFLVNADKGRLQTLELTWDPKLKEWFDVYGNEDRKPGEWGHWTGRGMT